MGIHEPIPQSQNPEGPGVDEEVGAPVEDGERRRPLSYTKASATDEDNPFEDQRYGPRSRWCPSDSPLRMVAVMAAVLFICVAVISASYNYGARMMLHQGQLCSFESSPMCPASELFVDPELHDVSTETLMFVGSGLFSDADRGMVRAIVAQSFRNISFELQRDAPLVAAMLNTVQLSQAQKEAVVSLMRLMGEPRLQRIGFEMAQAIRQAALPRANMPFSQKRHFVQERLEELLVPRRREIWDLRNELVPAALRQFWGEEKPWSMTLRPENIQVMETVHDDWSNAIGGHHEHFQVQLQVTAQALSPTEAAQRSYGVFGGVLEEGRALLDIIELHFHSLGHDLSMPQLAVSITGDESFGAEPLSCDIEEGKTAHWFLKAILCPLKFGAQGVDALRAVPRLMSFQQAPEADQALIDAQVEQAREAERAPTEETAWAPTAGGVKICQYARGKLCSVMDLLESSDVHGMAGLVLMRAASANFHGFLSDRDHAVVNGAVQEGFGNISKQIKTSNKNLAMNLGRIMISRTERDAILGLMRLTQDPRLQAIGLDVARAIRESARKAVFVKNGKQKEYIKHQIEMGLFPRRDEIFQLTKELFTPRMREFLGPTDLWSMTLDTANIQVMRTVDDTWAGVVGPHPEHAEERLRLTALAARPLSTFEEHLDISNGVIEEGRFLLEMVKLHARSLGFRLEMPSLAVESGEAGAFDVFKRESLSCDLSKDHQEHWFLKAIVCPLKFGTQGLDALRGIEDIMQFTPDRANFEFHDAREFAYHHAEQARPRCVYKRGKVCDAMDLFDNQDVHGVAVQVLMKSASTVFQGIFADTHHTLVYAAVEEVFRNISNDIKQFTPDLVGKLRGIDISQAEVTLLVSLMRLVQEPRLQSIGLDVARALRQSARTALYVSSDMKRSYLKHQIEEVMFQRREEILRLSEELYIPRMRAFLGDNDIWAMALDPANIRVMETVDKGWGDLIGEHPDIAERRHGMTASALAQMDSEDETQYDVFNGVVEEGRFVIAMIKFHAHSLGFDLDLPSLRLGTDDNYEGQHGTETLSCDLTPGTPGHWFLKAIVCPLKLGSLGLDAVRAATEIMHFRPNKVNLEFAAAEQQAIFNIIEQSSDAEHGSWQHCSYAEMSECPAGEMLLNPEFHTVATETLMKAGRGLFNTDDEPMVQNIVAKGFRNISRELKQVAPDVMSKLSTLGLTLEEKDAILMLMRLMDEPRVQAIGIEVARAIRDSVKIHESVTLFGMEYHIRRHIERHLSSRRGEIMALRELLVPQRLLDFLGQENMWSLTLHPDNIRVMETVSDGWDQLISGEHEHEHFQLQLEDAPQEWEPVQISQKSLGIFAGVLEEGRVLLDVFELHARSTGRNMSMPQLAVAVNSKSRFDSEPVSCDLGKGESALRFLKAVLCPLKFGAQGIDALRAAHKVAEAGEAAA